MNAAERLLKDRLLKLILHAPEFFSIPATNLVVEINEGTGRTYFLENDRIVAVAIEDDQETSR